jgi:hypothetical protein
MARAAAPISEQEQAAASHAEAPAVAGLAAEAPSSAQRMLALQRTAGNRAVSQMLARQTVAAATTATTTATPAASTVASTTDPRLGYRAAGVADTPGLDGRRLPFNSPGHFEAGWDWKQILDNLTQHDEEGYTFTDEVRCGANAALAIAIMYGPAQVMSFGRRVGQRAHGRQAALGRLGPHPTAAQTAAHESALDNLGAEAGAIFGADAIGMGFATYSALSDIAHAAKVAMTSNARGFSNGSEVALMAALAGPTTTLFTPIASRAAFADRLADLDEGEAYIVHVDTDVLAEGAATSVGQGNHFVVVGQEPGEFGNHFLYDPYPRSGRQYTTSFSDDFWTLFETAGGTWKWVSLMCRTRPPDH